MLHPLVPTRKAQAPDDSDPVPPARRFFSESFWNWGDKATWLIVAALVLTALAMATASYVMPRGRDSNQPTIKTY